MPLGTNVTELDRTNCVELMLHAFRSNHVVKALVFMPGATDEFYMFRRAHAHLTAPSPSLFDAVSALTNQTEIRVTFQPPLLLLHSDEDPLELDIQIDHSPTAERLKRARFLPCVCWFDRDWDSVQPVLKRTLKMDIRPWPTTFLAGHFYRHSFAAYDLSGWEALEAVALAGKASFTVGRRMNLFIPQKEVVFSPDPRVRIPPKLDAFPR
jgi:hypothetical protein